MGNEAMATGAISFQLRKCYDNVVPAFSHVEVLTRPSSLQRIAKEADVEAFPHMGLDLLPALISSVRAFIGHDSGPMHI